MDNLTLQFCSNSDATELFDYLGVDIIELTGNHLRDYDWMPLQEMLDRFDFGPEGTFVPQMERYNRGIVQKTVGVFAGLLQNYAHLPERYAQLVRFAQGGSRE